MGFYISSLSRSDPGCNKPCSGIQQVRCYQPAPSYNYKWTDIHYEASRGNIEKLQILLRTSDKELIDRKDYYGKTPLYWAAYKGQRSSMELLLRAGADVNSQCKHGGSPLHAAVGLFPECALLLIQYGANVNLSDNWGVTPMYLAACSGQIECIQLLVRAGAKITYRNKKTGEAPKQLASKTVLLSWIENHRKQPQSLKHISRLQIRETLGHHRLGAIRTFTIPVPLQRYLMFEDLILEESL
nr:PREDICTED: ankyrin repeat domain-containing protein 10-like [Latimeria chalumnae]|eukprot:XP_006006326.1 PREDICTED: ankyrin repeat domain-containing protein 10-like [Latimeria chalumnae]